MLTKYQCLTEWNHAKTIFQNDRALTLIPNEYFANGKRSN